MTDELKRKIDEFRRRTELFAKGELSVKEYKGFSGGFGSYAQRGAKASMLRLRMSGGRIDKERLAAIIQICEKYDISKLHATTCQTIQLHDIPLSSVADVLTDAVESGFYTLGGGGDFPRNVMASPLSGVEKDEYFDVLPYADRAEEYLFERADDVKLPRKLKVCFSNSEANVVHATFRDLGFAAVGDGKFDVYCAGGMGANPRMGVKVGESVDGSEILYYIKAMISFFCRYGNYENRAKARTRYIREVLGDEFTEKFNEELDKAFAEGGLDISVSEKTLTKAADGIAPKSERVIPQKQDGLYAVSVSPVGGIIRPELLKSIYEAIKDMESVSLRVAPDGTIYVINCTGSEAAKVLAATGGCAEKDIEKSVACIGSGICQQGLRNSQALLDAILDAVKPYDFKADALPKLRISGCVSSCGAQLAGCMGFRGGVKMRDGKPVPAFVLTIDGREQQGSEAFGEECGAIAEDEIPVFMTELGKAVTEKGISYHEFSDKHRGELEELINKYI